MNRMEIINQIWLELNTETKQIKVLLTLKLFRRCSKNPVLTYLVKIADFSLFGYFIFTKCADLMVK